MSLYSDTSVTSTGIDIGTTTTHLVISQLEIANVSAASRVPKLEISNRKIVYQSPIYMTPLSADGSIDATGVAAIVKAEYQRAGIGKHQVTSGAAIVTGETARLRNASQVIQELAMYAGDFVVASAGVHLESILAGRGSGAAKYSQDNHKIICNVDIGGGTTNIAVFSNGHLLDTACVGIGGRCIIFAEDGTIAKLTDSAEMFFDAIAKLKAIQTGESIGAAQLQLYGSLLAEAIIQCCVCGDPPQVSRRLLITDALRHDYRVDEYWFSGGVAELMRHPVAAGTYNDLGGYLAEGMVSALQHYGLNWHIPDMPSRATVIGAGMHSMQLSGSTICAKAEDLPVRNIPVVKVSCQADQYQSLPGSVRQSLAQHESDWKKFPVAIALERLPAVSYAALKSYACDLITIHKDLALAPPLVVLTSSDIAMALGQLIRLQDRELACLVIDGIITEHGDYIDIGKPLMHASTVPVVVKTLVFNQ